METKPLLTETSQKKIMAKKIMHEKYDESKNRIQWGHIFGVCFEHPNS